MVLTSQPVVLAVFSPIAGRLSDKIEPRVVASIGMGFSAAGLFLFTFIDPDTNFGFINTGLMLPSFGFALFTSPNTNAVMRAIVKRFYSVGTATFGAMRLICQMLMGITMVLFWLSIGSARITPEYCPLFLTSMRTVFIIFATHCVGGIFAAREGKGEVTNGQKNIHETCGLDRRWIINPTGLTSCR